VGHLAGRSCIVLQSVLAAFTGYLLVMLAAAARGARQAPPPAAVPMVVLVPAHDEEHTVGRALASLERADRPAGGVEVVVVADNCTDATAEVARRAGATVFEREQPEQRGKGPALAWALARMRAAGMAPEAVVMVDADCEVSQNFLRAAEARIGAGASAAQADYRVANPEASPTAALRYAGYALVNSVRPLAKSRLGLSAGLFGSGMVFRSDLLERHPWAAFSITEDLEYHLTLVTAGEVVQFAPEATVTSEMPVSRADTQTQRTRWEAGKIGLARRWAPRLLATEARRRDAQCAHAAIELLMPTQSLIVAGSGCSLAAGLLLRSRPLLRLATATLAGQTAFVLGGLAVAQAPAPVYRALTSAPALVADGLRMQGLILLGRAPRAWKRTARTPVK
jgi:hypothetical protein